MTLAEKVDYHRYMASREWALKKEEVKERARGACERCRSAPVQNVHHLTYARLGHEVVDTDLLGLCRPCHEFASGKRDDDPAVAVILALLEKSGMTLIWHGKPFQSASHWDIGPINGHGFMCDLKHSPTVEREKGLCMGDYRDDTTIVIPLWCHGGEDIWLHCMSL